MEVRNDAIAEFHSVIVSINGESHANHLGSGFFYRRHVGEPALIITAAHVVSNGMQTGSMHLFLDLVTREEEVFIIDHDFSFNQAGDYSVWVHTQYEDKHPVNKWKDVAIIRIPWQNWMIRMPYVVLEPEMPDHSAGLLCLGFPQSVQMKADERKVLDQKPENLSEEDWSSLKKNIVLPGMAEMEARATVDQCRTLDYFIIKYEDIAGGSHTEKEAIEGFSGCGIFSNAADRCNLRIHGILKKLPDDDPAFRQIYVVKSSFIRKALEAYPGNAGSAESTAFSLSDIIADWKAEYNCQSEKTGDCSLAEASGSSDSAGEAGESGSADENWRPVLMAIGSGSLSAETLIDETGDEAAALIRCPKGENCAECYHFFKGQLAKYGCFPSDFERKKGEALNYEMTVSGKDLKHFLMKGKEQVRVVLLCSGEDPAEVAGQMRTRAKPGKTLYLWNHPGEAYHGKYRKTQFMNIVHGPQRDRKSGFRLSLSKEPEIALVGVGKLMDCVFAEENFEGTPTENTKTENLAQLMQELWGE